MYGYRYKTIPAAILLAGLALALLIAWAAAQPMEAQILVPQPTTAPSPRPSPTPTPLLPPRGVASPAPSSPAPPATSAETPSPLPASASPATPLSSPGPVSNPSDPVNGSSSPNPSPAPSPSTSASPAPVNPEKPAPTIQNAVAAMARIQALLEYYFIEFGNYPDSLKQMVDAFNQNVPASMVRIAVSADPATGKPFTYQLQEGGAGYSLSLPDPSRYDGQQFVMTPLDWGWMKQIAGSERRQRLLGMCKYNLNALATAVEMAALDRKGQFPKDLKELIGVFMEEEIICPQSGKPYVYKLNEDGKSFTISCPQPAAHNLRALYYDSVQGIKELKNQ